MSRDRSLDIAVVGLSARFPGVADLAQWWSAIMAGQVLTRQMTRTELSSAGVSESLLDDPNYVPARGYLADADRFDNALFRISGRDAELMDPQHRLMLEAAWCALEDAGSPPLADDLTTAVFASGSGSGYLRSMLSRGPLDPQTLDQALHGCEPDFIASMISYRLKLTGPALAVQTACSSSLVGVHLAAQALLSGECDQALVVAAGIDFPQAGYLHIPGGIRSPSGTCRPFDAAAEGVVAGSGVACVVLRRLADALADSPPLYGVVLGTAINNDGAEKAGYFAPSVTGQESVIRAALRAADVPASSIGYLETHGTGTRVGDPIEWSAASAAFGGLGAEPGRIAVGALKASLGHLDAASGLAGLIKALYVVRHGMVPPVAGFARLNPLLETDRSPLFIPTEAGQWAGPRPMRAAVSSFGVGGTNAHVIVEQPPAAPATARRRRPDPSVSERLVVLSAADRDSLDRAAARLADHLRSVADDLADVSRTLATGRAALSERLAVAGTTSAEIADRLARGVGVVRGRVPADGPPPVIFVFPGQGSHVPAMAAPFAQTLPGFVDALDGCLAEFPAALSGRLRQALFDPRFPEVQLAATELAQPALFAIEYAAASALRGLGIVPRAVTGHSLGEITAACVAGALTLTDAARLVVARGQAMQACPPGGMLAVGCAAPQAERLVAEAGASLELAAVNGPHAVVLAGEPAAVRSFRSWLGGRVRTRLLKTNRAFHSSLIEPALSTLSKELATIRLRPPTLPYATNVTGQLIAVGEPVDPALFVRQARQPVRFADALAAAGPGSVVEVGPGQSLSALAWEAGMAAVPLCPARTRRPAQELCTALGALWAGGQPISLSALSRGGRLIHLPGYQFRGPRWLAPEVGSAAMADQPGAGQAPRPEPVAPPDAAGDAPEPAALLTTLWTEVLGHNDIGPDSDFFQLGGDSLTITQLARRIHDELGVRVPLREMLVDRTLGRQAETLVRILAARPDSEARQPIGA